MVMPFRNPVNQWSNHGIRLTYVVKYSPEGFPTGPINRYCLWNKLTVNVRAASMFNIYRQQFQLSYLINFKL